MPLTELPFGLQGHIFRSPMPFGKYDPEGEALHEFKRTNVSVIVLLASDEECLEKAGRNLQAFYREEGFEVIYLPIHDFGVPLIEHLENVITKTAELAQKGHNIAIHCSAGIGRTGMFAACVAKKVLGLSAEEAISWVRRYVPGAVETCEQEKLVTSYLC